VCLVSPVLAMTFICCITRGVTEKRRSKFTPLRVGAHSMFMPELAFRYAVGVAEDRICDPLMYLLRYKTLDNSL